MFEPTETTDAQGWRIFLPGSEECLAFAAQAFERANALDLSTPLGRYNFAQLMDFSCTLERASRGYDGDEGFMALINGHIGRRSSIAKLVGLRL